MRAPAIFLWLWAAAALLGFSLPASAGQIQHVIVIALENEDAKDIYNDAGSLYLNSLKAKSAYAEMFVDRLPTLPSEPHYLVMEGGTNEYADHKFLTDDDPSPGNLTNSGAHLTAQMDRSGRVTWMTYQEDIGPMTGACPITSAGRYAAKHNPFVFFKDVVGDPPSPTSPNCVKHTRPYEAFAKDLARGDIAHYVFITPNLCHDMHGRIFCPDGDFVHAADRWLAAELPRVIRWAETHSGVILLTWDQRGSASTNLIPFFAVGAGVKPGPSPTTYDHGSIVKSVEEIFGLPILDSVKGTRDLSDLFRSGQFP